MERKPLVSIIVPVYNVEKYLRQCIDLIKKQTYNKIEILLIDDGSTDSSGTICDELALTDQRIAVYHKSNGGLSDARNYGIKRSNGEFITCVDSDDLISIRYIEILVDSIISTDTEISIGSIIGIFNGNDEDLFFQHTDPRNATTIVLSPKQALRIILLQNEFDVSACAKLYKRSIFDGIEYPVGKLYEDLATTYKLISRCTRISYCNIIIYGYRQNRIGSITAEPFNLRRMELIESFSDFYVFIKDNYPELNNEVECRYAACVTGVLESLYLSSNRNDYRDLKKQLKKEIRTRVKIILRQRDILFRRKIKYIVAGIGRTPYTLLKKLYSGKQKPDSDYVV